MDNRTIRRPSLSRDSLPAMKIRVPLADFRFWQSATVAVPLSVASAIFVFATLAGVADRLDPGWSPSLGTLTGLTTGVLLAVAVSLGLRRTARTAGAAIGVLPAVFVLMYLWLVSW